MTTCIKQISLLLLIGLSLFGACKSTETTPADQVALGLNKSARVGTDLTVRVDTLRDSRCPTGAACIIAGDAVVSLSLSKGAAVEKRRLSLYGRFLKGRTDSTTVQFGISTYSVLLQDVTPYPDLTKLQSEQQAVIRITKL